MPRIILLSTMLMSSLGSAAIAQEARTISDAGTVFAIYNNDSGLGASDSPQLIMSVWGDGSIVWSHDRVNGGSPYFKSQVASDDVSSVLKHLVDIGVFEVPRLAQPKFGPDSQFTTILLRIDGKELKMDSWHEHYEANGKLVAGEHGLASLEEKKLLQSLAEQPAEYLHYRMTWLQLRLDAANLIPTEGSKTDGVPKMLHGKLTWQPIGTE